MGGCSRLSWLSSRKTQRKLLRVVCGQSQAITSVGNSPTSSSRVEVELLYGWLGVFLGGEEVFFYVPGKQHFPKLKMSFPINGEMWVLPAVRLLLRKCLCEEMSVLRLSQHHRRCHRVGQEWPIMSVSDEKVPPACLYRCAGTWCAQHGDGWKEPSSASHGSSCKSNSPLERLMWVQVGHNLLTDSVVF